MSYYRTCPICGANLDPQESCDCKTNEAAPLVQERPQESAELMDDAIIIAPAPQRVKKGTRL